MSAIEVKNESYEPAKLEAIYQNLLANYKAGKPQDYEIQLDGFKVVSRNNDPERFMSYSDFISPETKYISVLLFRTNLNSSDKYFFHLKPNQFFQQDQIKGLPEQAQSETELKEKWVKEQRYEELIRENEFLKSEIEEYELILAKQGNEIDDVKNNRDVSIQTVGNSLLKMALASDFVKNNVPIMNDLAGTPKKQEEQNTQASFKRKGQDIHDVEGQERNTQGLTDIEKRYILFIDEVRRRIGAVELANVMHLLDLISCNPQSIGFAMKQVTNFLKRNPKPTTDEKI